MAGIQDRHVVLFCHLINGREQRIEVLLCVDVLLAVRGQQNVLSLLQAKAGVDVGGLYFGEVCAKDLCHRGAGHVGALFGQATVREVAAGVLGIGHVDIGDDVDDAAVGLLGEALVFAAVAGFHVEDRDVEALCADHGQAGVGVAEYQDRVRHNFSHELVAARDDVAHGLAQVRADRVQVDLGIVQLEVVEEHAVEIVVVVLPCVRKNRVKIFPALLDHRCQADDLRPCADNDQELQLAVFFPIHVKFAHLCFPFMDATLGATHGYFQLLPKKINHTGSKNVSGCVGSKISLAHISVTRFSVSLRLMMLWV